MLSKEDVRQAVTALLRLQVEKRLLAKQPDEYYGWVAPATDPETGEATPGYWLGEADEQQALRRVESATADYQGACRRAWGDRDTEELQRDIRAAEAVLAAAKANLDEVRSYRERIVEARREELIQRLVARRFVREHRRAKAAEWHLYHPAVSQQLRTYIQLQLARGPLAPVSFVLLWLILQDTIQHGESFQTEALTAYDYLVDNPLATSSLDIDEPEFAVNKQRLAYLRELQAQAIRDRQAPAHENLDSRDLLADFEYHGLPERLGALWIEKGECCEHCHQGVRMRIVHEGAGYRYAKVCPNYRDDTQCTYDPCSPLRSTRAELRTWAQVELATAQAA